MKKILIRYILLIYISIQLFFGIIRMSPDIIYLSILEYALIIPIFIIVDSKNKKTGLLVKEYVSLLEQREYLKIENMLLGQKQGYQVKVLLTCLYLYQGDESKYVKAYEKIEKQKVILGYKSFRGYLINTNIYYRYLKNLSIDFPINQSKDFSYNGILNLIHDEKYSIAISLMEETQSRSVRDFFLVFKHHLLLECHKKLNMDIVDDVKKLKNLTDGNPLLKNIYTSNYEYLPTKQINSV